MYFYVGIIVLVVIVNNPNLPKLLLVIS